MDILETIESLFAYEETGISNFSKETYETSFKKFQEIAKDFDETVQNLYAASVGDESDTGRQDEDGQENIESFCISISENFVDYIRKNDENVSRGEREKRQRSHNIFMATYVLPHIMEMRNPYYRELAKAIEKSWAAAFQKSKIKAASFETVAGGFQRKFFGFSI